MARRRKPTEAERLRQHNEELKLALAENITVLAARQRLAARRWREFEAEMERRRRCGTADVQNPPAPTGAAELHDRVPGGDSRQQFWWERD